jgi:hypothetical protein
MADSSVNERNDKLFPDQLDSTKYTSGSSWFEDQTLPQSRPRDRSFPLSPDTLVNGDFRAASHRLCAAAGDLMISHMALKTVDDYLRDGGE